MNLPSRRQLTAHHLELMSCISASGKLHTSCYFNQGKTDKRTHRIIIAPKVQAEVMRGKKKKPKKPPTKQTFRVATEDDDCLSQLLFMKELKSPLFQHLKHNGRV